MLNELKKSGEKHKSIMTFLRKNVKPGFTAKQIVSNIEDMIKTDISFMTEVNNGIAFPVGISINDCCAHWTVSGQYDDKVIGENDIVKIDFGVHQNGYIIDGATTLFFNNDPVYRQLCKASQIALVTAIKEFGIDKNLGEIGEAIQEVIESYEVEKNGKIYKCKPIFNLSGHKINQFTIHDNKAVPNVKIPYNARVTDNEIYAIEPFVTLDNGSTYEYKKYSSHFMLDKSNKFVNNNHKLLYDKFKTLPFCDKWIEKDVKYKDILTLVKKNVVKSYPPIYTTNKQPVAQFEKTVAMIDGNKYIFN